MQLKISATTGLIIAVLAVSWASIFVRWCGDTPALVISFYRMWWSTLLFGTWHWVSKGRTSAASKPSGRDAVLIFLAGVLLALHFYTWIASLKFTTVAHSLILESTHPVFALILSPLILKEKGSLRAVIAVCITLVGIVIIAGQDFGVQSDQFLGDSLAVVSALLVTLYILIARMMRGRIALIPYLIRVYGMAAVVLLTLIGISGRPLIAYPLGIHGIMVLLALVPTGVGHSLINWAARKIQAYKVNLAILGEPVLASVMAYFFFGEVPYGLFYVGAFFIISGIVLALTGKGALRESE